MKEGVKGMLKTSPFVKKIKAAEIAQQVQSIVIVWINFVE